MVPNKLQYEPVGGSGQGSSRMNPEAPSYTPTFAQDDVGGELPLKTPMPTVMEEDPLKRGTFSGGLLGTASGSTVHEMTPAVDGVDPQADDAVYVDESGNKIQRDALEWAKSVERHMPQISLEEHCHVG